MTTTFVAISRRSFAAICRRPRRNYFDAVCITHLDDDHCKGFGEFFWLAHAKCYQDDERVRINELWVPAAAITEENLKDDAWLVRAEARHRLKEGKGIRVFSRPAHLKEWMDKNGIDFESRKHLIVDAGTLVPGYTKEGAAQAEFFVHSPFGWRQDEQTVIDRNEIFGCHAGHLPRRAARTPMRFSDRMSITRASLPSFRSRARRGTTIVCCGI